MSISRKAEFKLVKILGAWSRTLRHEAQLHGVPNSFGTGEIAREYGLVQRDGYRLGTTRLSDLNWWINETQGGLEIGSIALTVRYENGRFHLATKI